jgi:hypothetical protein
MVTLVNRAKVNTTTTGTGTINLGSAVDGYQTFADAGVVNTNVVRYTIEDGEAWEIGSGTYSSGTLTRSLDESSTGSLLNLSGEAVVYVTATGSDLLQPSDIGSTVQGYDANIVSDASYVHTDNNYTTTEKNKLAGIEAGATADQTKADIDALGIAASTANTLATARNISLTGDVSGSTNFDGSGNVSITAVVADDSHNHVISNVDGLQTALDGKAALNGSSSNNFDARTVKLANLEKSNLDTDGQLGFDSSQGLLVYRTQQGITGTTTVLDGANVAAGTGVSITNLGTGGTGAEEFSFSIGQAVGSNDSPTFSAPRASNRLSVGTTSPRINSGNTIEIAGGTSSFLMGVQDGSGRVQMRWNASTGTSPTYLVSNEQSARYEILDVTQSGDALWRIDHAPSGTAGNTISYTNILSLGTSTFTYNSNTVWHAGNDGSGSGLDADTVDGLQASQFIRSDATDTATGVITFSDRIQAHEIRTNTNQELILNAGESASYATGQTGEYVYVNAEQGLQINTSPDNWSSGWAGRDTFTFSSSGMQFPDGTTQTTAAPADEQDYGLITGSITTTNDYGALT